MKTRVRTIETGPTGAMRFYGCRPHGNLSATFFWNGPGSGLYLEIGYKNMTRIQHPSADGTYDSTAHVIAAIRAFLDCGGSLA